MASVMYIIVTFMLNPFFYSLMNRDMKRALGRLLGRRVLLKDEAIAVLSGVARRLLFMDLVYVQTSFDPL